MTDRPTHANLTIQLVEDASAWAKENRKAVEIKDLGSPGLWLRAWPSGGVSWVFRTGAGGQKITLGKWPGVTLKQARVTAAKERGMVADGANPVELRREARKASTIEDLAPRFKTDHIAGLAERTQKDYEDILADKILPGLGKVKMRDLDRPTVVRWHRGLAGMRRANYALSVLSVFCTLAKIWGERSGDNPCSGVPRHEESTHQRFLTPAETLALAGCLDGSAPACGIRLLILSGLRLGELLALEEGWIDWELGSVTIPAKRHKTGRKKGAKTLPLSAAALEVLKAMPRTLGSNRILPMAERAFEHYWDRIRKQAHIEDVRCHDLRHTFASWGAARGISLPILGALLGHTQASTTQRYAHLSQGPLRDAVETIGDALGAAMKKAPEGAS